MTHIDASERDFEATIVAALVGGAEGASALDGGADGGHGTIREAAVPYRAATLGGYRRRSPAHYDRALCLDTDTVVEFVVATQPKAWARLAQHHGPDVKARFLKCLAAEVASRGTVEVLRRGVKDSGCAFQLAVESYQVQRTSSGSIKLARGNGTIDPIGATPAHLLTVEQLEALSQIIEELNRRFGTDFSEDDKVFIRALEE